MRLLRTIRLVALFSGFTCLVCPGGVSAIVGEPLDLLDPSPREIDVYFEVSPREAPEQTRQIYSRAYVARVEPGQRSSELRVIVPGAVVEAHLLDDQRPVPESFSDFVWTFDVETGHVLSAELRGRVEPQLDWGFMKTQTEASIQVSMGTAVVGGFERPRHVLGNLVYGYCTDALDPTCRVVETTPFEPATGYVNAVGRVWVHSKILDVWNFSPLGEAVFLERSGPAGRFPEEKGTVEFPLPDGAETIPVVSNPPHGAPHELVDPAVRATLQ